MGRILPVLAGFLSGPALPIILGIIGAAGAVWMIYRMLKKSEDKKDNESAVYRVSTKQRGQEVADSLARLMADQLSMEKSGKLTKEGKAAYEQQERDAYETARRAGMLDSEIESTVRKVRGSMVWSAGKPVANAEIKASLEIQNKIWATLQASSRKDADYYESHLHRVHMDSEEAQHARQALEDASYLDKVKDWAIREVISGVSVRKTGL
jgi:hypothetical protein